MFYTKPNCNGTAYLFCLLFQWAFGVTCWEIFSLGRNPYPSIDNAEILDHIESGHRLKKPPLCQNEM